MFWIELIIVLAIIFIGVRVGGTFLAMAGGIGMFIMTFILHVTPSDPPITVILIMIAVICAAATMQACGGLDYLVRIAEKILRKNPKMITVLAPVVAYIFTFMCGTGHIVYSLLPVINEIAIETGVRPERPISASIVSSQQAITACPISAATVGILAFMAEATNYTKVNIFTLLIVCVPATLIGTVIAAIAVIKKGKELADDPEFQARVEAGLIEDFSKKVKKRKSQQRSKNFRYDLPHCHGGNRSSRRSQRFSSDAGRRKQTSAYDSNRNLYARSCGGYDPSYKTGQQQSS